LQCSLNLLSPGVTAECTQRKISKSTKQK